MSVKDNYGRSAVDLAREMGRVEILAPFHSGDGSFIATVRSQPEVTSASPSTRPCGQDFPIGGDVSSSERWVVLMGDNHVMCEDALGQVLVHSSRYGAFVAHCIEIDTDISFRDEANSWCRAFKRSLIGAGEVATNVDGKLGKSAVSNPAPFVTPSSQKKNESVFSPTRALFEKLKNRGRGDADHYMDASDPQLHERSEANQDHRSGNRTGSGPATPDSPKKVSERGRQLFSALKGAAKRLTESKGSQEDPLGGSQRKPSESKQAVGTATTVGRSRASEWPIKGAGGAARLDLSRHQRLYTARIAEGKWAEFIKKIPHEECSSSGNYAAQTHGNYTTQTHVCGDEHVDSMLQQYIDEERKRTNIQSNMSGELSNGKKYFHMEIVASVNGEMSCPPSPSSHFPTGANSERALLEAQIAKLKDEVHSVILSIPFPFMTVIILHPHPFAANRLKP